MRYHSDDQSQRNRNMVLQLHNKQMRCVMSLKIRTAKMISFRLISTSDLSRDTEAALLFPDTLHPELDTPSCLQRDTSWSKRLSAGPDQQRITNNESPERLLWLWSEHSDRF